MSLLFCVWDAIKFKLQEDQEEVEEMKRRKCSVIIHRLKEMIDDSVDGADVRIDANEDEILRLIDVIEHDDVSVAEAIRLISCKWKDQFTFG